MKVLTLSCLAIQMGSSVGFCSTMSVEMGQAELG